MRRRSCTISAKIRSSTLTMLNSLAHLKTSTCHGCDNFRPRSPIQLAIPTPKTVHCYYDPVRPKISSFGSGREPSLRNKTSLVRQVFQISRRFPDLSLDTKLTPQRCQGRSSSCRTTANSETFALQTFRTGSVQRISRPQAGSSAPLKSNPRHQHIPWNGVTATPAGGRQMNTPPVQIHLS